MKHRGLCLAGLLIVSVAWMASANVAPTMDDQYVATIEGTPVMLELRAQDEDIDLLDSGAHPLRFVLLEGPSYGILIGDMAAVRYEGPHDAVVELTYVPASGFVGTDVVTIAVYDPFDETATGTVTIEIEVAARRAEGVLSGNWSMSATWVPQSGSFSAFTTQLTEIYRIGALTMKGVAQIRNVLVSGAEKILLDALRFDGDVKLGDLSFSSTLALDPQAPSTAELFDYWRATVGFSLQGVNLRYTVYLATPVTASYQMLYAQASSGAMSFSSTIRLGMNDTCGFEFSQASASVMWSWCDLNMSAALAMSCDGFQQVTFNMSGLPIPGFMPGITLNAGLTFTMDANTLSTTLQWRPLAVGCVRVYSRLEIGGAQGVEIEGFSIYGVKLEFDVSGVKVVSATSLDPARNSSVTGHTDYFEVLRMSGTLMGCCGAPGMWRIATYFNEGATMLFDWGMTRLSTDVALSEHVNFSFETVFRSGFFGDPKLELSLGFITRW
ncbi:Ig-like domain-containing protein [Candidatus Bipolaricaulota bacterium]